ncbi:MAG: ribonuclease [Clostridia bacterium]|nr:ribonuclease [Clostridia bacterium]
MKRFLSVFLSITLIIAITFCALSLTSCSKKIDGKSLFNKLISIIFNENSEDTTGLTESTSTVTPDTKIDIDGVYTSKDDVALYIHTYGKLPSNFIKKAEAEALGWGGGSLEPYAPGKCIGGDYFGNYEGVLPKVEGRTYTECDIDTLGQSSRGAKRIVFSNDGYIYYTEDHYETFTLIYEGGSK